jgi:Domain of unknown function (DUF4396)
MVPLWLHALAIASLLAGVGCAVLIVIDECRRPQHMWIMNVVWPVTALFASFVAIWGYFRYGRLAHQALVRRAMECGEEPPHKKLTPFSIMVAKGAAHCGAGCTLGDLSAEWLAFAWPNIAIWFGWQSVFAEKMFAVWVLDFVFALLLGIAFQYFTITPMRNLAPLDGLKQAVKADVLSLTAWQVGMYLSMAGAQFWLFRSLLGVSLEVNSPEFWFVMQIAMLAGFATSYPVNWWLIRRGVKERM